MNEKIIYLDNAATTYPKPQSVINAAYECMRDYCGNAGRGSHPLALRSAEAVYGAREAIASLFGAKAENVIFTLNTTYALNMAIKGVMRRGGHMLISNMEHNSVLRPVAKLAAEKKITYDVFKAYSHKPLSSGDIISELISKLRRDTRAVACIHSSNICSYTLPIREIGAFCRRHKLLFIVDAAQSAGHVPIDMEADNIDILCLPAHKGLYSPQGVGIAILRDGLSIDTLIEGGNGVNSLDISMGLLSPERYEGGTLCTPALAGLCAGAEFVKAIGIDEVAGREEYLWHRAESQLSSIEGVTVYDKKHAGGILLFNIEGQDPEEVGDKLNKRGFCLRTGYHCAPLAHKALGTHDTGALRIGFGVFNTESEIDELCELVRQIAEKR